MNIDVLALKKKKTSIEIEPDTPENVPIGESDHDESPLPEQIER